MARCKQHRGHSPRRHQTLHIQPGAAYAKELKALADPNEVPEPPCGDLGEMPDGIRYFEVPAGEGRKLLFVRIGQDEPLFDEQTLRCPRRGRVGIRALSD